MDTETTAVPGAPAHAPRGLAGTTGAEDRQYVLTFACPDRVGIVARLGEFLAESGCLITEASYFLDHDTDHFFTRQSVRAESVAVDVEQLRAEFAPVAAEFGDEVRWRIWDTAEVKRAVLMVSRQGHCLRDLLGRVAQGDYPMEVAAVVGNHENLRGVAEAFGVPYHCVAFPADAVGKRAAFNEVQRIVDGYDPDAIVLARFMQILPPDLCQLWAGRAINIHHSFLPSFMGARPYHQAYRRGVKLIGATCHYVTGDLDDGSIIEQDVIRVTHKDTPTDLARLGRDAEMQVLARGLRFHLEDRVLVHGNRTVVFD